MRDRQREVSIISAALRDLLESDSWVNEETVEYIREHVIPNVWRDWKPKESE